LLVLLLGWNVHMQNFQLSGSSAEQKGIKVMSYNVLHFYSYLEAKGKKDEGTIIDFIAAQNANIICLQETKLQKKGDLNPLKLKALFPGINHLQLAHQSKWGGPVTFTSFPIVNMGELRFNDTNNMVIFTDLIIHSDTVRVYNCHLQSYGIRAEDYTIIDTLSFQQEQFREVKQLGRKLREAYEQRSIQIKKLKNHIEVCPYPVIVCGDFNDTPVSYTYQTMRSLLNDAFIEAGRGVSNTYRGKLPPFRIDYIFYSDHFKASQYKRPRVTYSDHYPVTVHLIKE
ncbi:MAG: endonuclease/exonuclease/phosphatase family protein, partial [Prolixibacteraceae bacterium]|nr:endonuclease/exonuclease/phosphatase family protein [Prolixibacteraceae bacterium]